MTTNICTLGASTSSSVILDVVSVETGLVWVVCVFCETFSVNMRKYLSPTELKCGGKRPGFQNNDWAS